MAQATSGVRSVLSNSAVYSATQTALGAARTRRYITSHHIRPTPSSTILDIGCGPGELVPFLPESAEYWGFDLSPDYIRTAQAKHGSRGRFECADVAGYAVGELAERVDIVLAMAVLHHLDDGEAKALVDSAWLALRPGGRLVTLDCTYADGQTRLSRALVSRDRGMNVRTPAGYRLLVEDSFSPVTVTVRHDLLRVPYTHCIMECTKEPAR